MATIADVARRAGVSIATVSRVLSPAPAPHPVHPATARRVREAAAALDFVPSAVARSLVSHRSGLFGLVVPDLADPHYPLIARGAEEVARQQGCSLLICNTLGDPQRLRDYLRLLRARRLDGAVFSGGGSFSAADLLALEASGLPAVLIGRPSHPTPLPSVSVDNTAAAHQATQHLLRLGRRRIAHLAGPPAQSTMDDRRAGYLQALVEAGRPPWVIETDGSAESGLALTSALLQEGPAQCPDAVFAATDRLALGVLAAAKDRGRRVPEDLAVVGFDDLPLAPLLRPSLSSVAQPGHLLGERALQLVLYRVAGEPVTSVVLPANLVARASSLPATH